MLTTFPSRLLLAALLLVGCGDDPGSPQVVSPDGDVARVDVTPSSVSVAVGATTQLSANAFTSSGTQLSGRSFSWSSGNTSIATVNGNGVVTGVAPGQTTVTVTSDGKQGTASVVVTSSSGGGAINRVVIAPTALQLPVQRQDYVTAVAYDAANVAVPGAAYTYSSSAASVASVSATGVVTAVSPGTATITATAGGRSGTATVTVTAASNTGITRVDVTPASGNVAVGATLQLTGAAYDAQNRVSTAESYLWNTGNPLVASVSQSGMVTGLAPGTAQVTLSVGGLSKTVAVTVTGGTAGNVVDVNPAVKYQTMSGWQGGGENGWFECNPTAFASYKNSLSDRLANELGIERISIPLRSGTENNRDYFGDFAAGRVDMTTFRNSWFVPINDNADPFVTDSSRFYWGYLDGFIDHSVLPLRQRLSARGERLYVVLSYVDFVQAITNKPFYPLRQPDEYAELVTMAFKHMQQKYGFAPDALELLLEPENTNYTATEMGRALVAAAGRLRSSGFNPEFIAPSTTSVWNAPNYYDQMRQVPGVAGLITELSYHRYIAVSHSAVMAIGLRAQRDGVRTAMLEHIGSGFDALYEDLTVGQVSAWMQYSNAYCGTRDNPANGGVYYQINQVDPANPRINITNDSKLFRQLFNYVRRGAVRIGATSGNGTDLRPVAFRNANGRHVAVVRVMRGLSFGVRGLPAGTYGINYGTPATAWNVNLPDQTIGAGGTVQVTMPSDGVITIYAR